ncbi:MAG: hypothetical protein II128_03270 [Atopobiaceae bacterium]|nr:hypothetical protein [Atopobiaceae bacterium]
MATNRDAQTEQPVGPMHYGHPRMPLAERAKIFTPFDPLKGFREELHRREQEVEAQQVAANRGQDWLSD